MPSTPPTHARLTESEPHHQRQVAESFDDPEQWRFGWDRPYTRDEWLDQVPTFGGHNQLPPANLQELRTGIGAAIDALGGIVTMHYTALVLTAARTSAPCSAGGPHPTL